MIRYIKLQNYRSFTDLNISFMRTNNTPLNFIILYGANGAGKSNLISVFETIFDLMQTMSIQNAILRYLEDNPDVKKVNGIPTQINAKRIIQTNKTINSPENMIIEIGFQLDGRNGLYLIEFDDNEIVKERLEYTIEKNRGVYFSIDKKKKTISDRIFKNLKPDLINQISRYWGKHSILAILNSASEMFSDNYFQKNVSSDLISILEYLKSINVFITKNDGQQGILNIARSLSPTDYPSGTIPRSDESKLDNFEKALNFYFKSLYIDICGVFYSKEYKDDSINYKLMFKKKISGVERTIPFYEESCGTKNLMYIMPYLIYATHGHIVAIDEIDNGIHDLLLNKLLLDAYNCNNGQIILTTHNTMLLNEYAFKDSFFFIDVDESGSRTIITPSSVGYRIQRDSNVFLNYINGKFKGLPWEEMHVDFNQLSLD